ncbi:TIR domain-containing protein [Nocardia sp. NPDC004068]|uniref:nSTAND1 domain-containing NTPase n=1 Tax=Nocardia sp. NPDC004068 TaxID=3364303 RepID=UPI003693C59E
MTRIFLSHSSRDNAAALALRQWLVEQDHELAEEIFLDIHPVHGIRAGADWQAALNAEAARCEAMVCLVSRNWTASRECAVEFRNAQNLGKDIFLPRLEPVDDDLGRRYQRSDLHGPGPVTTIRLEGTDDVVTFRTAGLHHLRNGLREAGITAERFPWPPEHDHERAPYRGWEPFEAVDAAVYFGRDHQILRGLDRLRDSRRAGRGLFVVLGPSGSGKSSFLRAGLLPRIARDHRTFVPLGLVRPERRAISGEHGLAAAVHTARRRAGLAAPPLGRVKTTLAQGDSTALRSWLTELHAAAVTRLPAGADPTLVLPIDQAEELFAADAGPEGPAVLELLGPILAERAVPLVVAAAIRTDRYERMQSAPPLAEVASDLFDELKPLGRERFREIITEPARRARATERPFEIEPEVVELLLADCRGGADTLPLLALTLSRLYRDYGSGTGRITAGDYREIGGIERVVAAEIDDILSRQPDRRAAELTLLRSAFVPWLATFPADATEPVRRIARYADLPNDARPLIDRFVERRLLVKDRRGSDTTVEVALESLLRQWEDLAGWLREQADTLRAADALERDAADWRRHGRGTEWLLTGSRLTDAEELAALPGYRDRLRPVADLLEASRDHETRRAATELEEARRQAEVARRHAEAMRRRARALGAAAAVVVVALVLAITAFALRSRESDRADARAREAIAARLVDQAWQMRSGARTEGDLRALHQILAAHALAPDATERDVLNARYELRHLDKVRRLPFPPKALDVSADGSTVAAANDTRVLVLRRGAPEEYLDLQDRPTHVAVSADGSTVVAADAMGTLYIARAGRPVRSREDTPEIWDLRVSADGSTIAVVHNGTLSIARDGAPARTSSIIGNFLDVELSANGSTVVARDDDANLYVFRDGADERFVPGGGGTALAVSADGSTLAVGGVDGEVVVTRDGEPERRFRSAKAVHHLAIDADGGAVAAADDSGHVVISRPGEADRTRDLSDSVERLGISADGGVVAAGDGRGMLMVVRAGTPDEVLHLPGRIGAVRVAADGSTVTAAASDVLFDVRPAVPRRTLLATSSLTDPGVSADGSTLVRVGPPGSLLITRKDAPERRFDVSGWAGAGFALSADGGTIVIGDGAGKLHILRADTPDFVLVPPGPVIRTYWRITAVAVSADGSTIAAAAEYPPTLFVYRTGSPSRSFPLPNQVDVLALSSDGSTVAAGDDHGRLHLVRDGAIEQPVSVRSKIEKMTVSDDGTTVVAADRYTVAVVRRGAPSRTLPMNDGVSTLTVSADGSTAVATGADITIIAANTTDPPRTLPMPEYKPNVAVSANGSTIAVADNTGNLLIARHGTVDRTIRLPQPVDSLTMSPDGSALAIGGLEGTVWYWRRADSAPVIIAHEDSGVRHIATDDHDLVLVTLSTVDRVPLLSPDPRALCAKLPAPITETEWREWISRDYPRRTEC